MKLYTEEQVRKALKMALGNLKISTENYFINSLTPIQLPTDDEIIGVYDSGIDRDTDWIAGAIWMRNKIQGGNNEQQ